MKFVVKKISELKLAGYNPRAMTQEERDALKASIQEFGFAEPIVINIHPKRMNIVIGGHQRISVAKEMGIEDVPCVELNLTLAKERQLNIRLNKNGGHWDLQALRKNFDVNDLLGWGFKSKELDFDVSALVHGENAEEVEPEKTSFVFRLGRIRFEVSDKQYASWIDAFTAESAKTDQEKVTIIKKRLKLQ